MRPEPDIRFVKDIRGTFAVVNSRRALPGTAGPVVSIHTTQAAADRAKRSSAHYRVMKLNKNLPVGAHVNPMTDAVIGKVAQLETPRFDHRVHRSFMPSQREGGR
jgi:hypothetical protein